VQKRTGREVYIDIQEVHKPELDAHLVSASIACKLEKRAGPSAGKVNVGALERISGSGTCT